METSLWRYIGKLKIINRNAIIKMGNKTIDKIKKDIARIMRNDIVEIGLKVSDVLSDDDLMMTYFTLYSRLIKKRKRKVHRADTFSCPNKLEDGLKCLEAKFKNGENVNCHQSRTILDTTSKDFMFFDWGILHFHLGMNKLQNGLIEGTKEIVYAIVKDDDVYFITIADHGHWSDKDLLEIVEHNWPKLIENFKIDGEPDMALSAKGISTVRKVGINTFIKLNSGLTYCTPGGGVVANGKSISARENTIHIVNRLEQSILEKVPDYFNSQNIALQRLDQVEHNLIATVDNNTNIYNGIIFLPKFIEEFGSFIE